MKQKCVCVCVSGEGWGCSSFSAQCLWALLAGVKTNTIVPAAGSQWEVTASPGRLCFVSPQLFLDFCSPERSPWLPASRKTSDRIESQHSSCDLVELPKVYLCPLVRQLSPLSGLTSTWIFTHLIKGRKSNSGEKSWHREYYLARHLQISL